jgi:hypothetical protein
MRRVSCSVSRKKLLRPFLKHGLNLQPPANHFNILFKVPTHRDCEQILFELNRSYAVA